MKRMHFFVFCFKMWNSLSTFWDIIIFASKGFCQVTAGISPPTRHFWWPVFSILVHCLLWMCRQRWDPQKLRITTHSKKYVHPTYTCIVEQGSQDFPGRRFKPGKNPGKTGVGKIGFPGIFPPKREKYPGSPRFLRPCRQNMLSVNWAGEVTPWLQVVLLPSLA